MSSNTNQANSGAIYSVKDLNTAKTAILGFQHMFAMFGATVLVPALTGLSVSTTLFFAGIGTLIFHLLTKGMVPAFLGSSFAFIIGYGTIAPNGEKELLPYACFGVACAGLLYMILAALFKLYGAKKIMTFFPPIVTGPIIIAIGLGLSSTAIDSCSSNWLIAVIAITIVVICNIWGKKMIKIIPIMLGILGASFVAILLTILFGAKMDVGGNEVYTLFDSSKFQLFSVSSIDAVKDANWIGFPIDWDMTAFSIFKDLDTELLTTSIITIVPIALATMIEHIGDISAISSTVGKNYIANPGLHRTLTGDGLATVLASLFGAPANTTYGENTGVLSLSRVFDPFVVRLAAFFAIIMSFCPKFAAIITAMPTAVTGGVSLVLYGMISAIGVRNVVENKVNFENTRNVIITAIILVLSIGIKYSAEGSINFSIGDVDISLSGLAVGALAGIILNIILPGKDYEFDDSETMEE